MEIIYEYKNLMRKRGFILLNPLFLQKTKMNL
jgi:hypothetical protein